MTRRKHATRWMLVLALAAAAAVTGARGVWARGALQRGDDAARTVAARAEKTAAQPAPGQPFQSADTILMIVWCARSRCRRYRPSVSSTAA